PGGSGIAVARGELTDTGLANLRVIFRAEPTHGGATNVGSRLVFAPDGALFVTLGDGFSPADSAQALDGDLGKIVRITTNGAPAPGNPFIGRPGARPEIWSLGHRNPQAAAINPATGKLWIVEHGARGGDEINVIRAGAQY